jgi:hypothetical protein
MGATPLSVMIISKMTFSKTNKMRHSADIQHNGRVLLHRVPFMLNVTTNPFMKNAMLSVVMLSVVAPAVILAFSFFKFACLKI